MGIYLFFPSFAMFLTTHLRCNLFQKCKHNVTDKALGQRKKINIRRGNDITRKLQRSFINIAPRRIGKSSSPTRIRIAIKVVCPRWHRNYRLRRGGGEETKAKGNFFPRFTLDRSRLVRFILRYVICALEKIYEQNHLPPHPTAASLSSKRRGYLAAIVDETFNFRPTST